MAHAIIRLRGTQNINPKTKDTLKYLRLNRINHCVVLPDNETTKGMLQTAKDYVTWGEISAETLAELIRTRGRLVGDKPVTDEHVKANTKFATIEELAKAIASGSFNYKQVDGIKPLFRLHPAKNGIEGIKRSFPNGGSLGYRGENINKLLTRMTGEVA